jgi:hypothetical protein
MSGNKPARTFDVFPANVVICPDNSIDTLDPRYVMAVQQHGVSGAKYVDTGRVIASEGILYVGVDSSTGPVTFFREAFIQQIDETNSIARFVTESGKIISAKRDNGCGCGSRLKNWSPINSLYSANRRDNQ